MAKEKQEEEAPDSQVQPTVEDNLRFYNMACEIPSDALKEIKAGRLKGMSDVNPMWRMKRMTEIFGPCGIGWKYTIDRQWEEAHEGEVKCFCNVSLYIRDPQTGEWSDPIPGNGGSSLVSKERSGPYVNDEGYKMALTDALSIAMKPLGIGANIWYGPKATGHNESKYEQYTKESSDTSHQSTSSGMNAVAYTGAQLQQALKELDEITTEQQFQQLWAKWAQSVPALCGNGTEFYKAACTKINQIKNGK